MSLETVAYTLLGVLAGVIFTIDSWRSVDDLEQGPSKSPKVRGLLFFLGTGIIPGIQILRNANSNALVIYTLAFAIAVIAFLIFLWIYAFALSYSRRRELQLGTSRWQLSAEAFHSSLVLLQSGLARFREQSDASISHQLIAQRDRSISFIIAAFDFLLKASYIDERGVEAFIKVTYTALDVCLKQCLEESGGSQKFRASVYYLDPQDQLLRFVTGAGPIDAPHSQRPFGIEVSLAGWALKYPGQAHYWSTSSTTQPSGAKPTFEHREITQRYQSVASYSPMPPPPSVVNHPRFVISIDSEDLGAITSYGRYVDKLMYSLGVLLRDAAAIMEITPEQLNAWSKGHRTPTTYSG